MNPLVALLFSLLAVSPSEDIIRFAPQNRPDLSSSVFVDQEGNLCALGDLAGKVVVIEFWATWCKPCMHSLPELLALQHLPAAQGKVEVIPCNADTDLWPIGVKRWAARNSQVLPNFRYFRPKGGKRNIAAHLPDPVTAFPTVLILDRQGKLATRWAGYSEGRLVDEINRVLAE